MAAVRGRIKQHIGGAAFNAAVEHGLERFVARVVMVERQVIAKDEDALGAAPKLRHELRQALDVLALDFDEDKAAGRVTVDRRMGGFDQRAFSHAARTPEERVIGRQAFGEAVGVVHQQIADVIDAFEEAEIDPRHGGHRIQHAACAAPDKGVGSTQISALGGRRRKPFQRLGDARKQGRQTLILSHKHILAFY